MRPTPYTLHARVTCTVLEYLCVHTWIRKKLFALKGETARGWPAVTGRGGPEWNVGLPRQRTIAHHPKARFKLLTLHLRLCQNNVVKYIEKHKRMDMQACV